MRVKVNGLIKEVEAIVVLFGEKNETTEGCEKFERR